MFTVWFVDVYFGIAVCYVWPCLLVFRLLSLRVVFRMLFPKVLFKMLSLKVVFQSLPLEVVFRMISSGCVLHHVYAELLCSSFAAMDPQGPPGSSAA